MLLIQRIATNTRTISLNQDQGIVQDAGIFEVFFTSRAICDVQGACFFRASIGKVAGLGTATSTF
jgi:hypothetical protein